MALKFSIKKAQYEKLSDEAKAHYIAGDKDGEYKLDIEGLPEPEDVEPLKRALEREKATVKETKKQLAEANEKLESAPNVEEIKKTHANETAKLTKFADKATRGAKALEIASKISTAPKLLAPEIEKRLAVDMTGDEPKTVILGKDGKPDTATDFDKLAQEFVANPDFKAIMIGNKASGGGSPQATFKPSGGGSPAGSSEQQPSFAAMDGKNLAAHIKAGKEASQQA